ncbi:transglutaminase-like domain-containing protein, partial [Kitasatospora sp. NPDC004799]|uniref:transglutaminase-like domain-containing protein n=1 Tax=Kitasatospora sp. NPDC004799 TaxID=3154460 RepID=UPI0033B805FA
FLTVGVLLFAAQRSTEPPVHPAARHQGGSVILSMPQDPGPGVHTFDVPLIALAGASTVGATPQTINWVVSDTTGMQDLAPTAHTFYRLFDNPTTGNLRYDAVAEATAMATGEVTEQGVATALRTWIRARVPYDGTQGLTADPLALLAGSNGAVCSDFANLHILLAQTLGLQARAVIFWGGFQYGSRSVWAADVGNYNNTLTNVQATDLMYHPVPGNQQGWDFTYHAIAEIGGTLHDAALNREGYSAQAIHQGLQVALPELAPAPATGFTATTQTPVLEFLASDFVNRTVGVNLRYHGDRITDSDFQANALSVVPIPPGTQNAYQDPVRLLFGTLPPGLTLHPDGILVGTPTTPGVYVFTVSSSLSAPGVIHTMVVN